MKQFPHFALRCGKRLSSKRGRPVHSPQGLAVSFFGRSQVPLLFKPLEERIQAPWTDAVAVPGKLLDHAQAEHRPLNCMMKNVEPDQTRVQIPVRGSSFLI